MRNKTTKAPDWFIEIRNQATNGLKTTSEKLGVNADWLNEKMKKQSELNQFIDMKKFNRGDISEIKLSIDFLNISYAYSWSRFRYENRENEFGTAERLIFNSRLKKIEIKKGIPTIIKETIDKLIKRFGKEVEIVQEYDKKD